MAKPAVEVPHQNTEGGQRTFLRDIHTDWLRNLQYWGSSIFLPGFGGVNGGRRPLWLPPDEVLDRNAAKLIVFGFNGWKEELTPGVQRLIKRGAGGAILFSRNFKDEKQIARLCASLKRCADKRPLLIMVDQEGGRVARLGTPFTTIPSARLIGRR
eukprot:jgi/Mesvir1/25197/Mv25363-RA.1